MIDRIVGARRVKFLFMMIRSFSQSTHLHLKSIGLHVITLKKITSAYCASSDWGRNQERLGGSLLLKLIEAFVRVRRAKGIE